MDAVMAELGFGMVLLMSAAGAWKWRRGEAARRISKGLRAYAEAQVAS